MPPRTPYSTGVLGQGLPDIQFDVDFSSATWDGVGNHQLLAVSGGAVRIILIIRCKTSVSYPGSVGNIFFGFATDTDYLATTVAGNLYVEDVLVGSPSADGYGSDVRMDFICTEEVLYTLETTSPDTGVFEVSVWYEPITSGATVTQGDGS